MAVEKHEYVPAPRWAGSPCNYRFPSGARCTMPRVHVIHQTFEAMVDEFAAEMADAVREAKRAAWAEGYDAGAQDFDCSLSDPGTPNPYDRPEDDSEPIGETP